MKYIRVRHLTGGSVFNALYMGNDDIQTGEIVVNSKNQQLEVKGDTSQAWLDSYGCGKAIEVRKDE